MNVIARTPFVIATALLLGAGGPGATPKSTTLRSKLYQTSRARLALARAKGQQRFAIMLVAVSGRSAEVIAAIEKMGGTIEYRAQDVDYLRATVPIDSVERVASDSN